MIRFLPVIVVTVICAIALVFGLVRIGVSLVLTLQAIGAFDLEAFREPVTEVREFLNVQNSHALIRLSPLSYFAVIAIMGGCLVFGAFFFLAPKAMGVSSSRHLSNGACWPICELPKHKPENQHSHRWDHLADHFGVLKSAAPPSIALPENQRATIMKFSFVRALFFSLISLPLGFILTALGFAVTRSPIDASAIFPWALAIAVLAGCAGGFWRSSPQVPNDPRQSSPDNI